ncbi:DUF3147 family protein [Candidatus Micrarchaeota archaeon]|jgi:hypothetical protein|nr:DUF3147 family protein [Candidatus Micrarchaeota archaeon]
MLDNFFLKAIISFFVGGFWATLSTIIAEKYGTRLGALITSLPSTLVVTLFFIAFTQTPEIAAEATAIIPVIMGINGLFILTYVILSKKNFYSAIIFPVLLWVLSVSFLIYINFNNLLLSILLFIVLFSFTFYIFTTKIKLQPCAGRNVKYTPLKILFRGILCGFIVCLGVVLGKFAGPLVGGSLSIFPAVFLSTIIIIHTEQGNSFSASLMRTVFLISSVNMVVYAILVNFLYPIMNYMLATVICYCASVAVALLFYKFSRRFEK